MHNEIKYIETCWNYMFTQFQKQLLHVDSCRHSMKATAVRLGARRNGAAEGRPRVSLRPLPAGVTQGHPAQRAPGMRR